MSKIILGEKEVRKEQKHKQDEEKKQ